MADPNGSGICICKVRWPVCHTELLCFIGYKSKIMPNPQLSKLCCDFYDVPTIQTAKDVLLKSVSLPEGDKRKSRRRTKIAETNMQDIITIFYEINPGDEPLFVARNLNNVPPLSMNNFDMSHIIEEMGKIKSRLSVLQEAQETSLTVHAALCKEATATTSKLTVSRSDSPSSSQPASPPDVATPVRSPVVRDDNGMDCDDTDILRLARIQGRYHPVNPLREVSAHSPTNSVLSQSSYASVIRRIEKSTKLYKTDVHMWMYVPELRLQCVIWLYLNPVTLVTSVMVHAEDLTLGLPPTTDETIETSVGKKMTS